MENYIITADVSDHYGTYSIIKGVSFENSYPDVYFRKSDLSDAEWQSFNSDLAHALSNITATANNTNEFANCITQTYKSLIDRYMPKKKLSNKRRKKKNKPWISSGIRNSIKTKQKLYNKAGKTGLYVDWSKYKCYLNLLTKVKHKAEYTYYKNLSILYGHNKSKTWKLINDIAQRKRKTGPQIKTLKDTNGVLLESPKKIADC